MMTRLSISIAVFAGVGSLAMGDPVVNGALDGSVARFSGDADLPAGARLPVRREIIDASLRSDEIELIGWDDRTLTVRDADGTIRQEPLIGVIAIVGSAQATAWTSPDADRLAGGTPVVIELTDGQRIFGSLGPWDSASIDEPATSDDDTIGILDRGLAVRALAFDSVGRIVFDPWARRAAMPTNWRPGIDDELVLANGDTLRGFLVEVGETLVFDPGSGDREYPLDRVAEVRLGNEPVPHAGPRLWMRTGEIFNGNPLATESNQDDAGFVEAGHVIAAWLDDRVRIPLTDLEMGSIEPGPSRRWASLSRGSAWTSPLGTPDIALDGPARTVWDLPPESAGFSAIARLGADLAEPTRAPGPWADAVLTVSVEQGGVTHLLGTYHLDVGSPEAVIAVELPDPGEARRKLILELGEGRYGPIQDRLLLHRPFLIGM